jgi:hypothetical protein
VWWGRAVFRVGSSGNTMRGANFNQPIGVWDMSSVTTTKKSACILFPGFHASSSPVHFIIPSRRARTSALVRRHHWRTQRMWIHVGYSTVVWLLLCMRGAVRVVDRGRAKTGGVAVWCGRAVFSGAAAFNQPIGGWDMSSVTTTRMSACILFLALHASSSSIHPIIPSRQACTGPPPCGDANWRTERMWIRVGYSTVAWLLCCLGPCARWTVGWAKAGGVAV